MSRFCSASSSLSYSSSSWLWVCDVVEEGQKRPSFSTMDGVVYDFVLVEDGE